MNALLSQFNDLLIGGDPLSLGIQFGLVLVGTLALTYQTAWVTRRFTYINSHVWVFIDAVVASLLVWLVYRLVLRFELNFWVAMVIFSLSAPVVQAVVQAIDDGRALIDVDAEKKSWLQTDFRLIRRAAFFAITLLLSYIKTAGKI